MTVRIAVLGAGRIGMAHLATLASLPVVADLVVSDLDVGRAAIAASEFEHVRDEPMDAVFASHPDGIVIAAPTTVHADLIQRGLEAGIAVFCEKPLAESVARSREVVAAVGAVEGARVQIGFQRRFDSGYRAARAALQAGELGELRRLHLVTADPVPPPADYVAVSGGIYRDCHIHDFDVLRWVTGREVVDVYATGANRGARYFADVGDVDESAALLTLDDGTLVTMHGSRYNGHGYDVRMEIHGSVGTRIVGLDDRAPLTSTEPGVVFPGGPPWQSFQERFAPAYRLEMQAFAEFASGAGESPCTPEEALEALYAAEAADLSRRQGRRVSIAEVRGG